MPTRNTRLGNIELRDVEGQPRRFEGLAIPYNQVINVPYGRERFVRGAFAEQAASNDALAYLNRHGEDGGIPVGVIDTLQERDAGLFFGGAWLTDPDNSETLLRDAQLSVQQIRSGINGVSVEFVPGRHRRDKAGVIEHYAGARLAAIAGSYAPAYQQARVALRSVAGATGGKRRMPSLTVAALTERRQALVSQQAVIRQLAEGEDRALEETETRDLETLTARLANVDALITEAQAEAQRRDAERRSLPSQVPGGGHPIIATRVEGVYGPGQEHSYFADLMHGTLNRNTEALERHMRHRALVTDLAQQMERRAVDSSDLAGAYPTTYYPDLFVPDVAYTGPLSAFFATTPITAPNPIIVPAFGATTGDTDVQSAENAALANVDVTTVPKTLTPKSIGGESVVSRQSVDGASPGTDIIIGNQLRELLMRDTEREIALVLEALTSSGSFTDTAGTTPAQSGRDLHKGIANALAKFYAGNAAGGAGARMLPAEGVFVNSTDWGNLTAGEDTAGRALLAYISPQNALGQLTAPGFQRGVIGGVPVEPAWAILSAVSEIIARRNDARQWKSGVLDIRLLEREGPQSVVFAIMQYFGFAVLEPKGVRRYTYTNV